MGLDFSEQGSRTSGPPFEGRVSCIRLRDRFGIGIGRKEGLAIYFIEVVGGRAEAERESGGVMPVDGWREGRDVTAMNSLK